MSFFNNNISITCISWRSVLLVGKKTEKKLCPQDTIKPLWSHKVVISTACNSKLKKRICVSTKYKTSDVLRNKLPWKTSCNWVWWKERADYVGYAYK